MATQLSIEPGQITCLQPSGVTTAAPARETHPKKPQARRDALARDAVGTTAGHRIPPGARKEPPGDVIRGTGTGN